MVKFLAPVQNSISAYVSQYRVDNVTLCLLSITTGVTPTFWTEGYSTPHFSGRKGEEFAVKCCQQKRSADIKLQ